MTGRRQTARARCGRAAVLLGATVGCGAASTDDSGVSDSSGSVVDTGPLTAATDDGDDTSPPGATGEPVDDTWLCPDDPQRTASFELGWDYKDGWIDLEPGGPMVITIGGQGAWMIPLGVRGDGFCVPANPSDYERVPRLEVRIEAQGQAEPIATVVGFPVSFEPLEPSGMGYTFIPMMLLDDLDVEGLEGVDVSMTAQLQVRDGPPLNYAFAGVLTVSE
ncbi:MAG: hypothetical protein K0V04_45530 [Deltaproteobacteria bacterium]|nr:hypothetical protein [Deltaproteobacteria bacterium]